jgi:hypothetical protein
MSADDDDASTLLREFAPVTAARVEELVGDAALDRALRPFAAFVAGILFSSTDRSAD